MQRSLIAPLHFLGGGISRHHNQEESQAMHRTKPIAADQAIAIVEKRRREARQYYARMRDDARRHREAQLNNSQPLPAAPDQSETK